MFLKSFRGFDIPLSKYITIYNLLACKKFMYLNTAIYFIFRDFKIFPNSIKMIKK